MVHYVILSSPQQCQWIVKVSKRGGEILANQLHLSQLSRKAPSKKVAKTIPGFAVIPQSFVDSPKGNSTITDDLVVPIESQQVRQEPTAMPWLSHFPHDLGS